MNTLISTMLSSNTSRHLTIPASLSLWYFFFSFLELSRTTSVAKKLHELFWTTFSMIQPTWWAVSPTKTVAVSMSVCSQIREFLLLISSTQHSMMHSTLLRVIYWSTGGWSDSVWPHFWIITLRRAIAFISLYLTKRSSQKTTTGTSKENATYSPYCYHGRAENRIRYCFLLRYAKIPSGHRS